MTDYRPIENAPRDGTLIDVLVPSKEGGFIAGRAHFQDAFDGTWWWEGTKPGDYAADPICECNHGDPLFWRPIGADEIIDRIGELVYRACGRDLTSLDGVVNVDFEPDTSCTILTLRRAGQVQNFRVTVDHA
jgi:hypothetical protein